MQYEFDKAKNAWFPKIDDDFMANYQLGYGFTAQGVPEPTKPQEEEKEAEPKEQIAPKKQKGLLSIFVTSISLRAFFQCLVFTFT